MKIKVIERNSAKIQAALDAVNGRASEHTYRVYRDIAALVADAEARRRNLRLYKNEAKGMQLHCISGLRVPRAYKWSRNATRVELTYCATGWCITALDRTTISGEGGSLRILLTPALDRVAFTRFQAALHTVLPALVR
jgi:hypothetical protein